jgi:hypothetical protein
VSYRRRYEREHYVKRKIRRDIYSRLVELSRREGLGLQELLEKLIEARELLEAYIAKESPRKIPVHKTLTVNGEVAYVITVDGTSITLTYRELRALCKSGLVDITLCSKTVLGG